MRIEKGYGHWKADFITEYNPIEAGLDRFVNLDKSFPGKNSLLAQTKAGCRKLRIILAIDSSVALAQPGEGVFHDGIAVGSITSACWVYRTDQNLAMAYVDPAFAAENTTLEVFVLGSAAAARVCEGCVYDSGNRLPKGL